MAGLVVTIVVGVALLAGGFWLLIQPNSARVLMQVEDQGWFSRTIYKKNQGVRVRRGTILGILAVAGSGIWVLISHNTLAFGPPNDWVLVLPFTAGVSIRLLPEVRFTVPIILALASLWLAFRVVNFPLFADFLIATEAELNKVSWTTRRRLVQDTIVVLTTVVLLTVFLFVVDIAWGWILSQKYVGVLRIDEGKIEQEFDVQKEQPW
jgi:preprotein translocase SecE subunit